MYSKGLIETFQLIMLVCFYEFDGVWLQPNLTAGMCFLYITQKGLIFYLNLPVMKIMIHVAYTLNHSANVGDMNSYSVCDTSFFLCRCFSGCLFGVK